VKVIGFVFGFGGVVLLIGGDKIINTSDTSLQMLLSQVACVIASCCYAIGSIITRLCPPVPTLSYSASGLLIGGMILVPTALIVDDLPASVTLEAISGLVYLAIFPTAIATLLLTLLIRRAGPPFLSLVNYQVPVWAVVIGAVVLGEKLPGHFLMALAIILGGLFLSQLKRGNRRAASCPRT
ncbi:MAG: DMT family transporter, partial [Opitutae bacterium]